MQFSPAKRTSTVYLQRNRAIGQRPENNQVVILHFLRPKSESFRSLFLLSEEKGEPAEWLNLERNKRNFFICRAKLFLDNAFASKEERDSSRAADVASENLLCSSFSCVFNARCNEAFCGIFRCNNLRFCETRQIKNGAMEKKEVAGSRSFVFPKSKSHFYSISSDL